MNKKMIILVLLTSIAACTTNKKTAIDGETNNEIASSIPINGTWVLKNVLMGDAMDAPCGFRNLDKVKEMNITFATDANGTMSLQGQSSVNSFSGKYSIKSYDAKSKTGKIKIEKIVSTRKAAIDPDFMECETRYFSYLENTEEFKIEEGKLQLIKSTPLPKSDYGNAPFGETYKSILYFDKK